MFHTVAYPWHLYHCHVFHYVTHCCLSTSLIFTILFTLYNNVISLSFCFHLFSFPTLFPPLIYFQPTHSLNFPSSTMASSSAILAVRPASTTAFVICQGSSRNRPWLASSTARMIHQNAKLNDPLGQTITIKAHRTSTQTSNMKQKLKSLQQKLQFDIEMKFINNKCKIRNIDYNTKKLC